MIHFRIDKAPASMDIDELAGELAGAEEYFTKHAGTPVATTQTQVGKFMNLRRNMVRAEFDERKDRDFHVIEYTSGFAVRHRESGTEQWMSDGVDVLCDNDDNTLSPGSSGFIRKWEDAMNEPGSETMEAYFPQFMED
jgi:hypothetical protein